MTIYDIGRQRLAAQSIAPATAETPGEVVQRLGAVQAQDYLGSLWAIGLRMNEATEAEVEQAIADKQIVRTWPMRGTLHFVAPADVLDPKREVAFPESVVEFFEGKLGQPPGGFPAELQARILRGRKPLTDRPGASLPDADFGKARTELETKLGRAPTDDDVISYLLYPKVFLDFAAAQARYSDLSVLPTSVFFHGMQSGEEASIEIEAGKTLIVKFLTVGVPHENGTRTVFFELNGQPRDVTIVDRSVESTIVRNEKCDTSDPKQVGAGMPGMVVTVAVNVGDVVEKGQKLLTLEAMKMETTVAAQHNGTIKQVLVKPGTKIETGDLLLRFE